VVREYLYDSNEAALSLRNQLSPMVTATETRQLQPTQ
jgi:hypothetical protein